MDYVTHMLGLQGWERVHKLDNYFCGEEDLVPDVSDDPPTSFRTKATLVRDLATQTPKEWLFLEPAQERKEEERRRAETRKRTLEIGMFSPNAKLSAARLP